jgi:hypothetical protein
MFLMAAKNPLEKRDQMIVAMTGTGEVEGLFDTGQFISFRAFLWPRASQPVGVLMSVL